MAKRLTPEDLARGRPDEVRFARHLVACDHHVVPVFSGGDDGAPMVWLRGGMAVAADVLSIDKAGRALWTEVKSKGVPGYRYRPIDGRPPCWEHGVNLRLFRDHYARLAKRAPLWIVVHERRSPPSDDYHPPTPPTLPSGQPDYADYKRHLVDADLWLAIRYDDARRHGREQRTWSRGPGWLWPRAAMKPISLRAT